MGLTGGTEATTLEKAVRVRLRIGKEFQKILPLIQLDTEESLATAENKLKFVFKLIERFVEDEKENLFESDKIALDHLQREVLGLVKEFNTLTKERRLERASDQQIRAGILLATE